MKNPNECIFLIRRGLPEASKHLRRVKLGGPNGDQVQGQEVLLKKRLGRIRDVVQGPFYIASRMANAQDYTDWSRNGFFKRELDSAGKR